MQRQYAFAKTLYFPINVVLTDFQIAPLALIVFRAYSCWYSLLVPSSLAYVIASGAFPALTLAFADDWYYSASRHSSANQRANRSVYGSVGVADILGHEALIRATYVVRAGKPDRAHAHLNVLLCMLNSSL